jgi:protein-L-isoaspartate(D-aspartate) O-methyltransferase
MNYATARRAMVDNQLRTVDVTDIAVLEVFDRVPRERFLPRDLATLAYADMDLKVTDGAPPRFVLEPGPLARLVQLAAPGSEDVVLEVGSSRGYGTAVLARLAASVVGLEEDASLVQAANAALVAEGVTNAAVVAGPLAKGWAKDAPYDVVVLMGSVDAVPDAILSQVKEGGRLVAVVGRGRTARARLFVRRGGEISGRDIFDVAIPPLPGFAVEERFSFTF